MNSLRLPLLVAAATLFACAHMIVRTGHLYPANDLARRDGVLEAVFEASGVGHGNVHLTLPDGELGRRHNG